MKRNIVYCAAQMTKRGNSVAGLTQRACTGEKRYSLVTRILTRASAGGDGYNKSDFQQGLHLQDQKN